MEKHIFAAFAGTDESVALLGNEIFDHTGRETSSVVETGMTINLAVDTTRQR